MKLAIRRALAIAALFASGPSYAGQLEDAKSCTSVPDSLARLTCFDKVFPKGSAPPPLPAEPSPATTLWTIVEEKSPIDDSPTVLAFLNSSDVFRYRQPGLILRCQENQTDAYFYHDGFITGAANVFFRFDEAPALFFGNWGSATSIQAVEAWDDGGAIAFIKKLIDTKKLAVRVQGSNNRVDAVFEDLGDVANAATKVAAACGWKLK